MTLFDYEPLRRALIGAGIDRLAAELDQLLERGLDMNRYGDIPRWRDAVIGLPELGPVSVKADAEAVSLRADVEVDLNALRASLALLHPWRKGPFDFFGLHIDTEWRSDMKWRRLEHAILPLAGRKVLDVGCGSGYHCWRMAGAGAELVVGIDPTPLFVYQYWALQRYARSSRVWVLPARMEELPRPLHSFDTVFSMGVLYHRRSPFDHLLELRDALVPGGQLVLETLVIDGDEQGVLVPQGRYSKMGNVWFLPSVEQLRSWLRKLKFEQIELVDVSLTTHQEQRSTDWMTFQSLADFLDPDDDSLTVEGYPAPRRAILTARV